MLNLMLNLGLQRNYTAKGKIVLLRNEQLVVVVVMITIDHTRNQKARICINISSTQCKR